MGETFELGKLVATKRVWELTNENAMFNAFVGRCITRYMLKDWGDLVPEDWESNDKALKGDHRILASYLIPKDIIADDEDRLWIITEWDRSVTTLLFPDEY